MTLELFRGRSSVGWGGVFTAIAVLLVFWHVLDRRRINGRFVLEPCSLLVLGFLTWHFSFWVIYYLGAASDYRIRAYFDLAPSTTIAAMLASVLGLAALVGGLRIGTGRAIWRPLPRFRATTWTVYVLPLIGACLVVVYMFVRGRELVGNYAGIFTEDDPTRRIYNLGILLVLTTVGPLMFFDRGGLRWKILVAIALVPTIMASVLMGSRWVMFSAAAIVASCLSLQGRSIRLGSVVIGFVCLSILGIGIKELRAGREIRTENILRERQTHPVVETLEEMGQASISVAATMELHKSPRDLLRGETIGAAILSVIPSGPRLLGLRVERPNEKVAAAYFPQRFYEEGFTLGHSIVAELYMNFGALGIVAGLYLMGVVLGRIYRRVLEKRRARELFVLLGLISLLIFGVRNDIFTWFRYAVWSASLLYVLGRYIDGANRSFHGVSRAI